MFFYVQCFLNFHHQMMNLLISRLFDNCQCWPQIALTLFGNHQLSVGKIVIRFSYFQIIVMTNVFTVFDHKNLKIMFWITIFLFIFSSNYHIEGGLKPFHVVLYINLGRKLVMSNMNAYVIIAFVFKSNCAILNIY